VTIDPIIVVRGLHFAATVVATGTASFLVLVAESGVDALRRRLVTLIWTALALAVLSGAAWLLLFAADLTDEPGAAWTVLSETRFGLIACARLLLAAALAVLIVWPRLRWLALATAAAFIALLGLIGHAGATPGAAGDLQLATDVVHLLAAGAWLGGLPALAILLAQAGSHPAWRASAVRRFGTLGVICVAALVASGLFNAWSLLSGPRDVLATDYGRLLLAKLALVAAMLAVAAVNRFHLTPRAAEPAAQRSLQRNSLAEAGLGLGVLLLVGALGTLEPTAHSHVHTPSAEIPAEAAMVHIHDVGVMADVAIIPGRAGPATVTIRISRDDSMAFAAKEVSLTLDPPAPRTTLIKRAAIRKPDGTWQVERIDIEQAGVWTVRIAVVPENGAPVMLDAPIVIDP
jgi:copper resistance protein D